MHFIEREDHYWIGTQAGLKDEKLFATSVEAAWGGSKGVKGSVGLPMVKDDTDNNCGT